MKKIFYPGCRIKRACPVASARLAEYLEERYHIPAAGCCKKDYTYLDEPDTTALLICNNCINDLAKVTANQKHEYVLDLIDRDETFPFPDYQGKRYVLQDCGHGYGDRPVDQTVRSLLQKMNIDYIEQPASSRVPYGMPTAEQEKLVKANAAGFAEEDVITYCGSCRLWMSQSGKRVVHVLELLFGGNDQRQE